MSNEKKGNSFEPKHIPSTGTGSKEEMAAFLEAGPEDANPSVLIAIEKHGAAEAIEQVTADGSPSSPVDGEPQADEGAVAVEQEMAELPDADVEDANSFVPTTIEKPEVAESTEQQVDEDGSPSPSVEPALRTDEMVPSIAVKSVFVKKHQCFFEEQPLPVIELAPRIMRYRTRREVLATGIGAVAMAASAGFLLPQATLGRMGVRRDMNSRAKEWLLNSALRVDDDVAEALYSHNRMVPTYTKSQIIPIKNNYNGTTPDPRYISAWNLTLEGLASGLSVSVDIRTLMNRFSVHEQITRFVCVEGWSAIAWWAGLRFDDLLRAYPPISQAKWARVESSVNLDTSGNPDPYFVSIDLATAHHPQTLLATHHDGQPLTVEYGAPLRLLVPVKLGLKNVKAITRITYSAEEPEITGLNMGIPRTTESRYRVREFMSNDADSDR
jgi:DMSO/TMAO reductase YedYZ molybdopterin-dependent catalytic subunit